MAKARSSYVCQNCGAITQRWQGKCESCGEWNTIVEEAAALGIGAAAARRSGAGAPSRSKTCRRRASIEPRIVTGVGELDRVAGGGFVAGSVDADRRRARHRQIDAADPGLRRAGAARRPRRLYLGRGIDRRRCACAPPGSASPTRRSNSPRRRCVEDIVATLGSGDAPEVRHHRFDPDDVERRDRIDAGHGQPGARLGPGADPLRQGERRGGRSWSAMSPRTARSPARASSNIWSMR